MRGCTYTVLFMILWYGLVIRSFLTSGFEPTLLIFVAGGLIPLLAVAKEIQRAMFYRRERRRAVESGRRQRGRITGYTRKALGFCITGFCRLCLDHKTKENRSPR